MLSLSSSARPLGALAFALLATACHGSSSDPVLPSAFTLDLGLTGRLLSAGEPSVMTVSELEHGDLNGDGDAVDQVVFLLEYGTKENTGLVLGRGPSYGYSPGGPLASLGATLAFGVNEHATGGRDRDGDGDDEDDVLAYYDRARDAIVDLGLPITFVAASEEHLAFDLVRSETPEGQYVTEPFAHDLATGESWSLGPAGALKVQAVAGDTVALAAYERQLGDLTHDGDANDIVAAFYDLPTRTLRLSDLAKAPGLEVELSEVTEHRGRWFFSTVSSAETLAVYDPATGTTRAVGPFYLRTALPELAPVVLLPAPDYTAGVWLYDPDTGALTDTHLAGTDVMALGSRLLVLVDEVLQGEDLDGDCELASWVPELYDPATGATENTGLSGVVVPIASGLLVRASEAHAHRDWNRDGDMDDSVLFTWDERTGALANTGLASQLGIGRLHEAFALVAVDEDARTGDLDGDGDRSDHVLHCYDLGTRQLTNLGLAVDDVPSGYDHALFFALESEQGQDLNGDGDRDDAVLFEVRPALRG